MYLSRYPLQPQLVADQERTSSTKPTHGSHLRIVLIAVFALLAIGGLPASANAAPAHVRITQATSVCGLSPDRQGVWRYDGTGTSWTQIGGPAGDVYAGGYGLVATNPTNGDVYRYLGTPGSWQRIGGPGAKFAVTDGTVFGLSPDRQGVWRYDGTGTSWTQIGGPARDIVPCP
jgi:hypothetical protein